MHHALTALGDALVVWIDPAKISLHTGGGHYARAKCLGMKMRRLRVPDIVTAKVLRAAERCEPYVISARYFKVEGLDGEMKKYRIIEDFVLNRENIERSAWSHMLHKRVSKRGFARHKGILMRSSEDIDAFLRGYVLQLLESLEKGGYDEDKGGELGAGRIDMSGQLVKSGGATHRFLIARMLGVKKFPLMITGVHEAWVTSVAAVNGQLSGESLAAKLLGIAEKYK